MFCCNLQPPWCLCSIILFAVSLCALLATHKAEQMRQLIKEGDNKLLRYGTLSEINGSGGVLDLT